jgi:hypothetical protein
MVTLFTDEKTEAGEPSQWLSHLYGMTNILVTCVCVCTTPTMTQVFEMVFSRHLLPHALGYSD